MNENVQTSMQQYNDLTGSKRPSTPYSRKLVSFFLEERDRMFFEVDKRSADIFGIVPRFLEHLFQSEKLVCSATSPQKNWTPSNLYSIISLHLVSKHLACTFLGWLKRVKLRWLGNSLL